MKIKRKIIFVLTVLSAIISLFSAVYEFLLPLYLSYIFSSKTSNTHAVTMIGGADGPVSILVNNSMVSYLITMIPMILTVIGIIYLIASKNSRNNVESEQG